MRPSSTRLPVLSQPGICGLSGKSSWAVVTCSTKGCACQIVPSEPLPLTLPPPHFHLAQILPPQLPQLPLVHTHESHALPLWPPQIFTLPSKHEGEFSLPLREIEAGNQYAHSTPDSKLAIPPQVLVVARAAVCKSRSSFAVSTHSTPSRLPTLLPSSCACPTSTGGSRRSNIHARIQGLGGGKPSLDCPAHLPPLYS